jgi:hypothetical protein
MASMAELRDAIATAMGSIQGLRTSAFVPDAPRPPIAVVMPDRIEYDVNARRGADRFFFTVTVLASRADDRAAQQNLDQYLVGPKSIKDAIEKDRTLGGKADTCRVTSMQNYSSVPVGETIYLSAQFIVEVVA